MKAILDLIKGQPVAFAAIVEALLALLVAFGVPLSPEQKTAIIGLTGTILALWTRSVVVPVDHLPSGQIPQLKEDRKQEKAAEKVIEKQDALLKEINKQDQP